MSVTDCWSTDRQNCQFVPYEDLLLCLYVKTVESHDAIHCFFVPGARHTATACCIVRRQIASMQSVCTCVCTLCIGLRGVTACRRPVFPTSVSWVILWCDVVCDCWRYYYNACGELAEVVGTTFYVAHWNDRWSARDWRKHVPASVHSR